MDICSLNHISIFVKPSALHFNDAIFKLFYLANSFWAFPYKCLMHICKICNESLRIENLFPVALWAHWPLLSENILFESCRFIVKCRHDVIMRTEWWGRLIITEPENVLVDSWIKHLLCILPLKLLVKEHQVGHEKFREGDITITCKECVLVSSLNFIRKPETSNLLWLVYI